MSEKFTDDVALMRLEEKIDGILDALGPVPSQKYLSSGQLEDSKIDLSIQNWIDDASSNLMILSGAYGSGKSHALHEFIGRLPTDGVYDFQVHGIPNLDKFECGSIIFIDHFDGYTANSNYLRRPPDVRDLSRHLEISKVCLVTNRDIEDRTQEIFRQTRYITRQRALGIKNVHLVSTRPWEASDVEEVLTATDPELGSHFGRLRSGLSSSDLEGMMRPPVLRMLLSIIDHHPRDWIPEYGEIYDDFLEHALSWDYDHNRSKLNAIEKRSILADVSYEIFSGPQNTISVGVRSASISSDSISKRINENPKITGDGQEYLDDFLKNNRCLMEIDPDEDKSSRIFRFQSKTIFEYFLARAINFRIQSGKLFGSSISGLDPHFLDTKFLYFARRFLPNELSVSAQELLSSSETNPMDRLILLYLIEDRPGFVQALRSAPEQYFEFLQSLTTLPDGHFVTKISMFQLVTIGRMSASEYIDYVRNAEEPFHLDIELQICRSPKGNLKYLEARFKNPDLVESAAVSIYRITQLAPEKAAELVEKADFLDETQILECKDALEKATESNELRSKISD